MPWNKDNYPDAMKNLSSATRNKANDIANSLLNEDYEEGRAISIAIATAKNRAESSNKKESHDSEEYHILPHPDGWAIRKTNAEKASFVFDNKELALDKAENMMKDKGGRLVIHDHEGNIQRHKNY